MVLDNRGYVKVVDFGMSKKLTGKTWTMCGKFKFIILTICLFQIFFFISPLYLGTPDYLAPEIILNEGHDLAVDYWALGVLIYEMVTGIPPFYSTDPMEVYEKILMGAPSIPSTFSKNLTDLVKKLLKSQQAKRLGNTKGGNKTVMEHKWFASFDWEAVAAGRLVAPFIPKIEGVQDTSNFEHFEPIDVPVS